MCGWIQLDPDVRRHDDGLMHRAAMRHLQQPLFLLCGHSMGKMDADVDATDAVRTFGHAPFRVDAQAVLRNTVPPAELPDEVCDTTGDGSDKEFNRTHSGVLPSVLHRLVGDDSMPAAHNIVTRSAMIDRRQLHTAPDLAHYGYKWPASHSIGCIGRLVSLRPIMNLVGKVRSRLRIDIGCDIDGFIVRHRPPPASRHVGLDKCGGHAS